MKILVVTLVLCIASTLAELTEEQKEMLKPYKKECLAELKLDEAVVEKAKKEFKEQGKTEFGDELNCYAACMFKKVGFMTEDGKFDEEMVRALAADQYPEDKLNAAIEACKNEVGKNECETAGKLIACFLKQGAAVGA